MLILALLNLPDRVFTIPAVLAVPAGEAGPAVEEANFVGMLEQKVVAARVAVHSPRHYWNFGAICTILAEPPPSLEQAGGSTSPRAYHDL
jgi:hypothetical protein